MVVFVDVEDVVVFVEVEDVEVFVDVDDVEVDVEVLVDVVVVVSTFRDSTTIGSKVTFYRLPLFHHLVYASVEIPVLRIAVRGHVHDFFVGGVAPHYYPVYPSGRVIGHSHIELS